MNCTISEERVRKGAEKLAKSMNTKQQGRLDGFFTATPKTSVPKKASAKDAKGKGDKGKGVKRKVSYCLAALILPCGLYRLT
jgi:flap endonuclease-1